LNLIVGGLFTISGQEDDLRTEIVRGSMLNAKCACLPILIHPVIIQSS